MTVVSLQVISVYIFAGKLICALESCDKPCYIENNGHVHDYCGQGHAKDHRRRIESVWPGTHGQHHHHPPSSHYPHQVVTHRHNLRSHSGKTCRLRPRLHGYVFI